MLRGCFGGTLCPGGHRGPRGLAPLRGTEPDAGEALFTVLVSAVGCFHHFYFPGAALSSPLQSPCLVVPSGGDALCSPPHCPVPWPVLPAFGFCSALPFAKQPVYSEQQTYWVCLTTTTRALGPLSAGGLSWHILPAVWFAIEALHSQWLRLLLIAVHVLEPAGCSTGCWPG